MSTDPYSLVETLLHQIVQAPEADLSLDDLAERAGLSPFHLQRLFKDWVGVSPKKFMQHLTIEAAKERLRASASVLEASYDAGLSGPGRLHDLMVSIEAMTPGEYKTGGQGIEITYGLHDTPFGHCAIATTSRGICGMTFETKERPAIEDIRSRWPQADFRHDQDATALLIEQIFAVGKLVSEKTSLKLVVPATRFQLQVWRALLDIPEGCVTTYGGLAEGLGLGRQSARAVGQAVGRNPIGWIIPCHRVIRQTGAVTGYRWGTERKIAMLGWEATRAG